MAANDLLDRYLYAVSRHLPAQRRDDLAQNDLIAELAANLRAQMEDKGAALGRPLSEDEQADLLRRHGHPIMVAARYQPHRSLIGPEIFPFYWFTVKRVLPWVIGIWLLVTAVAVIFGSPNTPIAQRVDVGHIITGLFGTVFQFLAWMTGAFALLEYFKGHARNELTHPKWDPRKLPKADPLADRNGPRHPYADVIASAIFLAWLLAFPRFPILMFGPYVSWRLLNMDLPAIWHTFYWIIIAFNCVQLVAKFALLFRPVRRYYHIIDSAIHLLGIGALAFLLRAHDYVGQANFGGSPMSPQTVATINASIHRGLLLVLVLAVGQFLWEIVQWLRPQSAARVTSKIGAPS
ncbi:MAG TPA: hypothetical protein VGY94_05490 [Acidobacteriaceae bacterium]|jgi:hypothetical protein|nr:hypothetical protein [Acidobacteriaceae bacterium]